jgi:addiction module HigA family antidote
MVAGAPPARGADAVVIADDHREAVMAERLDGMRPGEILLGESMEPMGIAGRPLAAKNDVPPSRISEIGKARRRVAADTALRLGRFSQTARTPTGTASAWPSQG